VLFRSSATSYRIREDTNEDNNPAIVAGDTILPTFPKTVQYALTWAGGTVVFDRRGIIEPTASPLGATLCVFTQNDPDSDCIIIAPTRMNIGKILNQGGVCDAANCQAK